MLLSCYGSYGIREAVAFNPELLQLLDGGWLLAVAHVRGGGWLGRAWAEAGRGMGKAASVGDLMAVAAFVKQVRGLLF
jgi:oligopeptidase B